MNLLLDGVCWKAAKEIRTPIFEYKLDCFNQTLSGFLNGLPLAIRTRNLRADGPISSFGRGFNDGSEL